MGFFANRKSTKSWKIGKRHADNENFSEAMTCFDDAARITTDQKKIHENKSWYYLIETIDHSKSGRLEEAKDSYAKLIDTLQNYKEECIKAPGVGSIARFNTSYAAITAFTNRYDKYMTQVKSR